jgi:hypothetical protein
VGNVTAPPWGHKPPSVDDPKERDVSAAPEDPRWEWIETSTLDQPDQWTRGRCNHLNAVPVQQDAALGGETVAHLCIDCDTQLPADWRQRPARGGVFARPEPVVLHDEWILPIRRSNV